MKSPARIRMPARAGQFYDSSPSRLKATAEEYLANVEDASGAFVGGVVPHAGWMYSGRIAAKVFSVLARTAAPDTFVILGAVHRWNGSRAAVFPSGAWLTPLGEIAIDEELASAILKSSDIFSESITAHDMEHSIEVQLPFIQVLAPKARIVPIAMPPISDAVRAGEALGKAIAESKIAAVVVASTDLTHYGMGYGSPDHGPLSTAMPWMRKNDGRIIEMAAALNAESILPEARQNLNACGPGALAAATAAARMLGATGGRLLEYTTSADVMDEMDSDRAVGYAGILFEKKST